jgi:hypothetical protein
MKRKKVGFEMRWMTLASKIREALPLLGLHQELGRRLEVELGIQVDGPGLRLPLGMLRRVPVQPQRRAPQDRTWQTLLATSEHSIHVKQRGLKMRWMTGRAVSGSWVFAVFQGTLNGGRQFLRNGRSNRHNVPLYGKSDRLFSQGLKFETR